MAECGPANPLQQFKHQTSLDRTLQQDRLASHRPHPAQGFRSPDPNVGLLDPEFEAFQARLPLPDLFAHQQLPQSSFGAPSPAPSWAQDFQQLSLAPAPLPYQHYPAQSGPSTAGWAQGFRPQTAQSAPRMQHGASPSPLAFQQRARMGYGGYQSQFASPSNFAGSVQQSKGKAPVYEQYDDAAFEQAFAHARDELVEESAEGETMAAGSEMQMEESHQNVDAWQEKLQSRKGAIDENLRRVAEQTDQSKQQDFTLEEIGQLQGLMQNDQQSLSSLEDSTQIEEKAAQEEQDALAATAQELLSKIEDNKTDKFRNSQFLGLMRKLRDREVKVEGDKMVETTVSNAPFRQQQQPPQHPLLSFNLPYSTSTRPWHDSGYASRIATPTTPMMSYDSAHFDTHICNTPGCKADHAMDHWESPAAATTTSHAKLNATNSTPIRFDNSEQPPSPLAATAGSGPYVDTRPPDYGVLPQLESDADLGRIDPRDGQAVVDLLNDPHAEMRQGAIDPDEIRTSEFASTSTFSTPVLAPGGPPFYGDLRAMHGARSVIGSPRASVSEMLYGHDGTLESPEVWTGTRGEREARMGAERGYVWKEARQRHHRSG
ncbi:hypothetical protein LTR53_001101 [Teratosphaeriaceae sp. CCFEE 6253]|nr:hypothetical protein LTR53_001101 [Teratosphaeriaceae sp. CCFEE 6253]